MKDYPSNEMRSNWQLDGSQFLYDVIGIFHDGVVSKRQLGYKRQLTLPGASRIRRRPVESSRGKK